MSPESLLRALCARHGLPHDAGRSFLPLVEKALASAEPMRDRILRWVDGCLAERADGPAASSRAQTDEELLLAVARVLHPWTPSETMLALGTDRRPAEGA
jgi:hypothetical protein